MVWTSTGKREAHPLPGSMLPAQEPNRLPAGIDNVPGLAAAPVAGTDRISKGAALAARKVGANLAPRVSEESLRRAAGLSSSGFLLAHWHPYDAGRGLVRGEGDGLDELLHPCPFKPHEESPIFHGRRAQAESLL